LKRQWAVVEREGGKKGGKYEGVGREQNVPVKRSWLCRRVGRAVVERKLGEGYVEETMMGSSHLLQSSLYTTSWVTYSSYTSSLAFMGRRWGRVL